MQNALALEPGSGPHYYRKRAAEMLSQAERAPNPKIRDGYLELAATWTELAEHFESHDRWRRNPRSFF